MHPYQCIPLPGNNVLSEVRIEAEPAFRTKGAILTNMTSKMRTPMNRSIGHNLIRVRSGSDKGIGESPQDL